MRSRFFFYGFVAAKDVQFFFKKALTLTRRHRVCLGYTEEGTA